MATIVQNKKGFKVIEVSLVEIKGFGGFGVCDSCCMFIEPQNFIAVLNRCYCDNCYSIWMKKAIRYEEDTLYEELSFERMKRHLKMK